MIDFWTIFLASVVVFLFIWWLKTTRDSTFPPGPPTVPFIGNLLSVNPNTLLEKFEDYKKKYGDVFSLVTGSKVLVVVSGYDTLRDVFIKHGDVVSERPDSFLTREIGKNKGVSHASGALWKEHRTFTLNALREFGFGKRSLESRIIEEIEVFVEETTSKKGKPFNIHSLINVCISNIMCSIAFGHRYDHSDKNFVSLLDKINQNLSNGNILFVATIFPFVRYIPGDPCRIKKVLSNVEDVENHLRQILKDHKKEFDENSPRDFIDVYMKKIKSEKNNPNTTFDEEQLLKILAELFVAGTETSSTALRWFSLFMIRHPDVQDKMRKEINNVIGSSRYPNMEDKQNLPYCEAVIHEVLRIGAIAPISVPHGLTRDLPYKGFTIPKDALLIPNLYSVFLDEKIFQDPHAFRPERFLDEKGNLQNTEKVLVFSLGRRVCLGEALARMELFLFVTSMIQRFKLLPGDPEHLPPVEGVFGITYAPKDFVLKAVGV
ncbi:cytochrome P450 2C8-like [Saccostrea echinata]|uniref:cytochrome P450 2C8-like n=1 Tax=Saccostrea echinata TaxID=191078 RepID=UPI002A83FC53|nr:cytochrome P450 2C8-like [Saccostrea echinata]